MCHLDGIIHVGRNRIVVVVALNLLITILEIDIVGIHIIHLQPLVEVILHVTVSHDHAFRLDLVLLAGSEYKAHQHHRKYI